MAPALSELTFKEAFGRIGDVPDLVTISAEETVAAALDTMARTRVSTLAVTSATGKITALIGFHDIVLHVLRRLGADGLLEEPVDRVLSLDPAAESYRVWERDVNDTIAATLAEFTRGLHRALVTDVSGAVPAHVFSQSDAVNYLYLHPEVSPVDLGASLSQLGFKKAVVSVRDNVSAREAFKALLDASVLSAPIVDEDGWLKGTLSTADLRGLTSDTLATLDLPVLEFIASRRFVHLNSTPREITPASTVKDAIDAMKITGSHRVWVTEHGKVVGVVSMSDVIRMVL